MQKSTLAFLGIGAAVIILVVFLLSSKGQLPLQGVVVSSSGGSSSGGSSSGGSSSGGAACVDRARIKTFGKNESEPDFTFQEYTALKAGCLLGPVTDEELDAMTCPAGCKSGSLQKTFLPTWKIGLRYLTCTWKKTCGSADSSKICAGTACLGDGSCESLYQTGDERCKCQGSSTSSATPSWGACAPCLWLGETCDPTSGPPCCATKVGGQWQDMVRNVDVCEK